MFLSLHANGFYNLMRNTYQKQLHFQPKCNHSRMFQQGRLKHYPQGVKLTRRLNGRDEDKTKLDIRISRRGIVALEGSTIKIKHEYQSAIGHLLLIHIAEINPGIENADGNLFLTLITVRYSARTAISIYITCKLEREIWMG